LQWLDGRRLTKTVLRICSASLPMAATAWLTSELAALLPLRGLALHLVQVIAAIGLAAVVFYLCCRVLRIEELAEAVNAVTGRFARTLRRR
jgi:hypothetical protein